MIAVKPVSAPPPVTRFAPSPTGWLHMGHAFSAVLGHRLARKSGGLWLLRIEDIDATRCRPQFTQALLDDLAWLGLAFDGTPLIQTSRHAAHSEALARLGRMGLTYPCFCTRADIAAAATAPHGAAPAYPGTCRHLHPAEAWEKARSQPHAIRLNAGAAADRTGPLHWEESGVGTVPANPQPAGDVVLARKDIGVGYMLAAVVDDAFQGVTQIVRGTDLRETTPTQRLLQALLGYPAPRYQHHRLLLAADGRRLAKRDSAQTLRALRESGVDGMALAHRLSRIPEKGPDLHVPVSTSWPEQACDQ